MQLLVGAPSEKLEWFERNNEVFHKFSVLRGKLGVTNSGSDDDSLDRKNIRIA
jgi:hypothetical protein